MERLTQIVRKVSQGSCTLMPGCQLTTERSANAARHTFYWTLQRLSRHIPCGIKLRGELGDVIRRLPAQAGGALQSRNSGGHPTAAGCDSCAIAVCRCCAVATGLRRGHRLRGARDLLGLLLRLRRERRCRRGCRGPIRRGVWRRLRGAGVAARRRVATLCALWVRQLLAVGCGN